MALLTCPDCRGRVSSEAVSCPHCGFPVSDLGRLTALRERRVFTDDEFEARKKHLLGSNEKTKWSPLHILAQVLGAILRFVLVLFRSVKGRLAMALAIAAAIFWAFVSSPLTASAEGEVLSLDSRECCRGMIGFTDMTGDTREFFASGAGRRREVGDAVTVFYNPDRPTEADITKITDGMVVGVYVLFLLIVLPAAAPLIRRMGDWERRRRRIYTSKC